MAEQDWLVTNEGECLNAEVIYPQTDWHHPYRLYRFLTDLEDILEQVEDPQLRLRQICPLVRHLLNHSEWLQMNFLPPDTTTGWSVLMLYDEPNFPITVQTVAWSPGSISPIHNHATWGIVAILSGVEKNTFWQRSPSNTSPVLGRVGIAHPTTQRQQVVPVGEHQFYPGDILCLMPDTIHHVEVVGDEPTISFNLYGETNYSQRFEFDPIQGIAKNF